MGTCLTQEWEGFPCNVHSFPCCGIPAVQAYLLGQPSPANHRQTICSLKANLPFLILREILIAREDERQFFANIIPE